MAKSKMQDLSGQYISRITSLEEAPETPAKEPAEQKKTIKQKQDITASRRFDFRITEDAREDLKDLAAMNRLSASAYLNSLIAQKAREQREELELYRSKKA